MIVRLWRGIDMCLDRYLWNRLWLFPNGRVFCLTASVVYTYRCDVHCVTCHDYRNGDHIKGI